MNQTDFLSNGLRLLIAGFIMGWGPCLAHTAVLLFPFIGATKKNWQEGLRVGLLFSMGRLLALAILGGLATITFSFINQFFSPQRSRWLYLILALFMIGVGVFVILGKGFRIHIGRGILDKATKSMFLFGFLVGFAPCLPYLAVLTYIACVAENIILKGIFYAALFAIGSAVAPVALGALMGVIPERLFKRAKLRKGFALLCAAVLILFGLHLIYYVLNLV
ncbi:MAG: sulfite exporter TauE/SafE family protein [Candidatus Omnitrophica bacterium]|nr:sulfite exporter TauE/SafE family protein [Candidatus Omnitrophota bacterium]